MTFVQRQISFTFQLGQGNFGNSGFNTVTVSGLRCSCTINKSGLPGFNNAQVRIYGLTNSIMNQLSTLGLPKQYQARNNRITINAGDSVSGMPIVYSGIIMDAWADFNASPDVSFNITSQASFLDAMRPVPPTSYNGSVDVATVISGIATQLGYVFENNGVSVQISNPYFPGTLRQQAITAAAAANINLYFDDTGGTGTVMAICPKGGSRGSVIPLISADTGMVGYPSYSGNNVAFKVLYNPSIKFLGNVQIQSIIKPASRIWTVIQMIHNLEAQMPNGQWFTDLQGYPNEGVPTIPT